MGRKSSAKAQPKPAATSSPAGSSGSGGSSSPLKYAAIAAVAIAIVVAVYVLNAKPAPPVPQAPARQAVAGVPESAKQGPHPQANLPPLPFDPEPPARSPEVVRASYKFAAE